MISARAAFPIALIGAAVLSAAAPVTPTTAAAQDALDQLTSTSGLPLLRWWGSMTMYSNLAGADVVLSAGPSFIATIMFYAGSLPWFIAMLLFAIGGQGSILDLAGEWVDTTMSAIIGVFFTVGRDGLSPIGWLMIAALIVTLAVGLLRARGLGAAELWRRGGSFVLIVTLLFFATGQLRDNPGDSDARGTGGYSPPFGTPGWLVVTVQDTVSFLTDIPASTVQLASGLADTSNGDDPSLLGCPDYINQLQTNVGADGTIEGAISGMWTTAALNTYSAVQFSDSSDLGQQVVCRMLDRQSGAATWTSFATDEALLAEAGVRRGTGTSGANTITDGVANSTGSNLFRYSLNTSNGQWSAAMMGWALCDRTADGWVFNDRYVGYGDDQSVDELSTQCGQIMEAVVNQDGDIVDTEGNTVDLGVFQVDSGGIGDRVDQIGDDQARTELEQFLRALTGQNPNAASAFMFASVAPWGAFPIIIIGGVILMLSLSIVAFLVAFYAALAAALFSSKPWSAVVWPPVARLLGAAIITGGASLIMGIVALFATAVSTMFAVATPGTGSTLAVIGSGLAPGLAVLGLHFMLRKLRVPSPLSLGGARAWAKGAPFIAGAAGAAVGAGVGGMLTRAGSEAAGKAMAAGGRKLGKVALDKVGLGGLGNALLGAVPGRGLMGGGTRKAGAETPTEAISARAQAEATNQAKVGEVGEDGVMNFGDRKSELTAAKQDSRALDRASRQQQREQAKEERKEQRAGAKHQSRLQRIQQQNEIRARSQEWINKHKEGRKPGFERSVLTKVSANFAARASLNKEQLADEWRKAKQVGASMADAARRGTREAADLASMLADKDMRNGLFTGTMRKAGEGVGSAADAARYGVGASMRTATEATRGYMGHVAKDPKAYIGAALTATGIGATVGLPLMAVAGVQAGKRQAADRRAAADQQISDFQQRQRDAAAGQRPPEVPIPETPNNPAGSLGRDEKA